MRAVSGLGGIAFVGVALPTVAPVSAASRPAITTNEQSARLVLRIDPSTILSLLSAWRSNGITLIPFHRTSRNCDTPFDAGAARKLRSDHSTMRIAITADHNGVSLKARLVAWLEAHGHE